MRSLILLGVATLLTTLIPAWLVVKTTTFAIALMYFGLYPIAVNHPEYRLLVSPAKWFVWSIPTHGKSCVDEVEPFLTTMQPNGLSSTFKQKGHALPKHLSRPSRANRRLLLLSILLMTTTAILRTKTELLVVSS